MPTPRTLLFLLPLLLAPAGAAAQDPAHSAHAGKETRAIKALSAEEAEALLNGEGAGYALAAELNHYPGPRHALDLRAELELTEAQAAAVERIFRAMNERARELGRRIVERERELDAAFAAGTVTPESLARLVREIGRDQAELRVVHLAAHLETQAALSAEQVRRYDRLRGYAADGGHRHE